VVSRSLGMIMARYSTWKSTWILLWAKMCLRSSTSLIEAISISGPLAKLGIPLPISTWMCSNAVYSADYLLTANPACFCSRILFTSSLSSFSPLSFSPLSLPPFSSPPFFLPPSPPPRLVFFPFASYPARKSYACGLILWKSYTA